MTTQTRDLRVRVKPCVQGTAGLELSISGRPDWGKVIP